MAITAATRSELITLVVGMFGAAPGASVLTELAAQYEAGASISNIANGLASTSVFASLYPTFLTTEEFSTQFVANLFAETDSAVQAELVDIAVSLLNAGTTRGELIVLALNALAAVPTTDATYGASASALANKVEVAIDYSVTLKLSGSSLEDLQNVISSVTSDSATKDAALEANATKFNLGVEFTLTTASDVFNGGAKYDTFYGNYGNDAAIGHGATTYGLGDILDGKGGLDTLSLTVSGTDAPADVIVRNIETIKVSSAFDTTFGASLVENSPALNFVLSAGANAAITGAANLSKVTAIGTGNLTVAGATAATTISSTAGDLTVSGASAATSISKIATGDLTVTGASTATTFTVGGTGNLLVDYTSTTGVTTAKLALAGATGILNVSDGNGIEAVTISTSGTNNVTLTAGTAATNVSISGSGTNTFDLSAGGSVAAILTLDASTSTATNTFTLANTLQTTDTIKGGTGADTLSANFTSATLVKPTLSGVETIKADFDAAAILNLANATGVTAIALAGGTANATISAVASTVTSLTSTTATGANDIKLSYTNASAALLTTTLGTTAATAYNDITLVNTSGLILNTTGAGGVTVADVILNGDQSEITVTTNGALTVTNSLDVTGGDIGSITVTANKNTDLKILHNDGSVGAIALTVADDVANVDFLVSGSEGTGGGITVSVGDDANVSAGVYFEDGDLGDITIDVGDGSVFDSWFETDGGSAGNVTATGNNGQVNLAVNVSGGGIGDVDFTITGADASGSFLGLQADGGSIGDITISIADGANLDFGVSAASSWDEDEVGTEGNIGNVSITIGDDSYISGNVTASGGDIGDITINVNGFEASGNLLFTANWVSGDTDDDKSADDYVRGGNIGNITLNITGEEASFDLEAVASGGNIGDVAINITGEHASGYVELQATKQGTGGTGGSIGAVTITTGDENGFEIDLSAEVNIGLVTLNAGNGGSGSIYFASGLGDAEGVVATVGDNYYFDLTVSGFDGDMGDITVTAGDDFSGSFDFASGDGDVGNISVTAGDDASIDFRIVGYSGGDFGTFSVTAGDNADIDFNFSGGGAMSIGGITLTLGDDANVELDQDSGGDFGDISINAGADFSGNFDFDGLGGDFGDITVETGVDADITFEFSGSSGDSFGDVTFIGGNAASNASLYLAASNGNDYNSVGEIDASNWAGHLNVDLSGVATGTTITVGAGGSWVKGTDQQDNIFLGAGSDTVVFDGTGVDSIFGFKAGATFDVLDVANSANFTAYTSNTADTLVSGDLTLLTDIVGGEDITTAAGLLAALNGGEYASIDATAGAGTYTFVTAASGAANTFYVFNAVETGDANFDSVTLIGVVNSSTTFSSLVAANFS